MLRRTITFFQFQMGKYRGPLIAPLSSSSSSSNQKQQQQQQQQPQQKHPLQEEVRRALESQKSKSGAGAGAAAGDQAVRVAQQIAERVAREDARDERKIADLYDSRRGNRPTVFREKNNDASGDDELFEDDDGVGEQEELAGAVTGRAAFEIPTLAAPAPPEAWVFKPQLLDANRMPTTLDLDEQQQQQQLEKEGDVDVDGPEDSNKFRHIERLLSPALAAALRRRCVDWNIKQPTPIQQAVLSVALSRSGRRDVCCISPTGTGKTLCYALPAIQTSLECNGAGEDATAMLAEARIQARDAARAQIESRRAEQQNVTCRYCGLNVKQQRVCPQTGAPHPPVPTLMTTAPSPIEDEDETGGKKSNNSNKPAPPLGALPPSSTSAAAPSSLILCPTNALVDQVHYVMRGLHCGLRLACLRSGTDEASQTTMVRRLAGCDILVATPAMALTLVRKRRLTLKSVRFVAIDEVDHSLELPQYDLLNLVLAQLPVTVAGGLRNKNVLAPSSSRSYYSSVEGKDGEQIQVRRMLVGATLPKPLVPFAAKLLHPTRARWVVGSLLEDSCNSATTTSSASKGKSLTSSIPQVLSSGNNDEAAPHLDTFGGVTVSTNITHSVLMVSRLEKTDKIRWLYDTGRIAPTQPTVIFCNHRASAKFLAEALRGSTLAHHDVRVVSVFSGQSEEARMSCLKQFHQGAAQILVATDAYARGIDFPNVFAVIQYDFPATFDVFIHRAGRCGRRGNPGRNFVLFEPQDARWAGRLAGYLRQRRQDVPPLLAKYVKQSWADLYREQVQGLTLRRRNPSTNASMHNNPMGMADHRFPRTEGTWKRNRFKDSSD